MLKTGLYSAGSRLPERRCTGQRRHSGMRTLSKTNLEDITVGCTFLGAGGGGSFNEGLHRLYSGLDAGHTFRLMSPDEIGDDEYAAAPYGVGSTAPLSEEEKKRYAG